jgi:hypothetical protein
MITQTVPKEETPILFGMDVDDELERSLLFKILRPPHRNHLRLLAHLFRREVFRSLRALQLASLLPPPCLKVSLLLRMMTTMSVFEVCE